VRASEIDGHLVLVGMMGTGKTTVGTVLARRLGRPLIDSDAEVEARTGRTVREIFETDGEAAYRPLETEALLDALTSAAPAVIAAAGGVVLSATNRQALKEHAGLVVWLRADPPCSPSGSATTTIARSSTTMTPLAPSSGWPPSGPRCTPRWPIVIVDEDTKSPEQIADEILA
jgi:hypothetical protein